MKLNASLRVAMLGALAVAFTVALADPALAQANVFTTATSWFRGSIMTGLAIFVIFVAGIMWMMGRLAIATAASVGLGAMVIANADTIAGWMGF